MSSRGIAAQFTFTNGLVRARAEAVDGARDELLAGAALARDEHARRCVGATFSISWKSRCIGALVPIISYFASCSRETSASARFGVRRLEHVLHADEHALAGERLLEEVARAELDGVDRVVHRRVAADHDDRHVARRLVAADALERLEAAHLRELHVEDRQVDGRVRAREDRERVLGASRRRCTL